jgi:hypothetical protein
MISEKQLEANRRDALRSCSSTSAPGKKRVSLNNLRHGLTGQTTVLSPEDRAAHDKFCAGLLHCLQPENALELQVAQSIAEDHWRLNRVFAIESNIFALGHFESPAASSEEHPAVHPDDLEIHTALNTARVFLADAKQLALLSIYEQRIHRNLQKSIVQLDGLQDSPQTASCASGGKWVWICECPNPPGNRHQNQHLPGHLMHPISHGSAKGAEATRVARVSTEAQRVRERPVLRGFPMEAKGLLASLRRCLF